MNTINLLRPEIIICCIIIFITSIVFKVINKAEAQINSKRVLITILLSALLFTCCGFWGMNDGIYNGFWYFIVMILFNLGLGTLLVYLYEKKFLGVFTNKYASEILLMCVYCALGILGFSLIFNTFNDSGLGFSYASAAFFVWIPYFFKLALNALFEIQAPVYKVWYLDEYREEPDFDGVNIRNILLLSLDIVKDVNQKSASNIRVKAPVDMKFGEWFQSFILSYNEKYEDSPIQYKYLDGTSMGWIFYIKPTFWRGRKMIETNKSIAKNNLNEKLTIVASRVKITYQ